MGLDITVQRLKKVLPQGEDVNFITLDELKRYKEDYCTTEEDFDYKEHFQKQIIDNFVEGECVVSFDW